MLYPFVKTKKREEENISVLGKYRYQNDPSFDTGIYFFIFQKSIQEIQKGMGYDLDNVSIFVGRFMSLS